MIALRAVVWKILICATTIAAITIAPIASASHGGAANSSVDVSSLTVSPAGAEIWTDGTCYRFEVSAFSGSAPAEGERVGIRVSVQDYDGDNDVLNDENRDLTLSFCDPDGAGPASNLGGAAPDPSAGTQTGNGPAATDCDDTNMTPNDGADLCTDIGRNMHAQERAIVQRECVTDASGRCAFGVAVTDVSTSETVFGNGNVSAWADIDEQNDFDLGEPQQSVSFSTRSGVQPYEFECQPTTQTRVEGGRAEFSCQARAPGAHISSDLEVTLDVLAGPNAEEIDPFVCAVTREDGSTASPGPDPTPSNPTPGACGYNDTLGPNSPSGTDNVVLCIQQPASSTDPGTRFCDEHEQRYSMTVTWGGRPDSLACSPDGATVPVGSSVTVSCVVRDAGGTSVGAGTTVRFAEEGPGYLDRTSCVTGSDGTCFAIATTTSSESGTQTITGTLTSGNCDAAGQPEPGSTARCADTATIAWSTTHVAECNDGADNDGDGSVDLDDWDCRSSDDLSESPAPHGAITIRYKRVSPRGFTGQVAHTFTRCQAKRVVRLHRIGFGVVGRDTTGPQGNYFVPFVARRGRYRARVLARTVTIDGADFRCNADSSPVIGVRRR